MKTFKQGYLTYTGCCFLFLLRKRSAHLGIWSFPNMGRSQLKQNILARYDCVGKEDLGKGCWNPNTWQIWQRWLSFNLEKSLVPKIVMYFTAFQNCCKNAWLSPSFSLNSSQPLLIKSILGIRTHSIQADWNFAVHPFYLVTLNGGCWWWGWWRLRTNAVGNTFMESLSKFKTRLETRGYIRNTL